MSVTDPMANLEKVMAENLQVMSDSATQGEIQNISMEPEVLKAEPFNSREYMDTYQFNSGKSQHLNLAVAEAPQASDELSQFRIQWQPVVEQMRSIRLPDTKVMIAGQKIEIPSIIKQYANDIHQGSFVKMALALFGLPRMKRILAHATKSNQMNKPALWLNQAIWVECKKEYSHMLHVSMSEEVRASLNTMDLSKVDRLNSGLSQIFGPVLYRELERLAKSQKMTPYAVLMVLVDTIIKDRDERSKPVTTSSIWDGILVEGDSANTHDVQDVQEVA